MFLIKFSVGVLCVITCVKIASIKASKIKSELKFYDSLVIACDSLIAGLSYSKATLKEILNVDYPSESFRVLIKNFLNEEKIEILENLTEDENLKVNSFLYSLGKSDAKTQKSTVLSYKNDFLRKREEMKKKYDKNYSLILKIGFSIGLMLFILVI